MRSFAIIAAVAALTGAATAKHCQNITVPVKITGRNGVFDKAALMPNSDIDVTNFILNLARQGHNYTEEQLKGYANVGGSYNLATTYCQPDSGAPNVVQLLTHGIGFDRSYWDNPFNNYNYSYVNVAVDQYKFATFSWDRLGIGMSSKGEPINEIQTALEVAALKALTDKLRAGTIGGKDVPKFEKVLHIGHSYGSVQSYALTAMYPNISDGVGLTGFSQNGSFLPFFLLGGNFAQANLHVPAAKTLPNGYIAPIAQEGVHINFFAPGDFDPKFLPYATQTGQPVTYGELLTIGGGAGSPNPIAAPVLIITGERDVPFCGGDCFKAPTGFSSIPETSKAMFENAKPFEVSIVKGAGHGLNYQYTHVVTYKTILDFFVNNGVGPSGSKGGNGGGSSGGSAGSDSGSGYPHGGNGKHWSA
ncbi:hypothetical protein AC579_1736 [Pseudocercospora musae]|uniref:AB hydrolase-1 domain-containing protein n=1 Tax=Pseudocercospora musae TaxID=113226 RepID=A0A139IFB0_9PEZI|nr:hypothetical protein AC579_1736 [Pseudocercospora musae]